MNNGKKNAFIGLNHALIGNSSGIITLHTLHFTYLTLSLGIEIFM